MNGKVIEKNVLPTSCAVSRERAISITLPLRSHAQTIVKWQFVRWMWHTTFYKNASHVMFYEDIQVSATVMLPAVDSFVMFVSTTIHST